VIQAIIFMKCKQNIYGELFSDDDYNLLKNCKLCPRECGDDRFKGGTGFCLTDAGLNISSICIHNGEEPVISGQSGICNIFFSGCNLRCVYCQNYEISRSGSGCGYVTGDLEKTLDRIEATLSLGIKAVGFVSPSHLVPQVKSIIRGLNSRGLNPVIVYNTNGYDKVDVIKSLSGIIDVYLPDLKYVSKEIAFEYSCTENYPEVALKALKEMYFQKGSSLITDETGMAKSGILLRHLVLPGHAAESVKVLGVIADEISTGIHISLMSQYNPTNQVRNHAVLNRTLYKEEYESVVREMEKLGFRNGWIQGMDSFENYKPDFSKENPF
jgi:putative pyruvate formate lyase activating enzyme